MRYLNHRADFQPREWPTNYRCCRSIFFRSKASTHGRPIASNLYGCLLEARRLSTDLNLHCEECSASYWKRWKTRFKIVYTIRIIENDTFFKVQLLTAGGFFGAIKPSMLIGILKCTQLWLVDAKKCVVPTDRRSGLSQEHDPIPHHTEFCQARTFFWEGKPSHDPLPARRLADPVSNP